LTYSDLTRSFEAHNVDAAAFHHVDHVQVACELLTKYDFIDATAAYARGIKSIAAKAGVPDKFSATITYAFMSLIAERMARSKGEPFEAFLGKNPDLLSKNVLAKWYAPERLNSDIARKIFLMPETP
jgi:hypothetical protein